VAETHRPSIASVAPPLRVAIGLVWLLACQPRVDAGGPAIFNPQSSSSDRPAEILSVPTNTRMALLNRQNTESQTVEADRLKLSRVGATSAGRIDKLTEGGQVGPAVPIVTVVSSLAVVIGIFAALVWASRKSNGSSATGRVLPDEAIKVLGNKPLGSGSSILLIRCGRGMMVVGVSPAGMYPISHLTDQEEVRNLEAICEGGTPVTFGETLQAMRLEPAMRERVYPAEALGATRKRLFAEA
jgi:flagellar protein FliO/FliZ